MTYRTDSAMSGPTGSRAAPKGGTAPAAAPAAPAANPINHHPQVYHHEHLQQTQNIPLPGTYQPAHPQQNGKG